MNRQSEGAGDEVPFIDFVKLFCNHKPTYGYSMQTIEEALDMLIENQEEYCEGGLVREEFLELLMSRGGP